MATDDEYLVFTGTWNNLPDGDALLLESGHDLDQAEADFICSRVDVNAWFTQVGAGHAMGPLDLVLALGNLGITEVENVLNGVNNHDSTPAAGDDQQAVKRAKNRSVVLTIPIELWDVNPDLTVDAANYGCRYNGPPLGRSLAEGRNRSFTFPRNVGWRWFLMNRSGGAAPATTLREAAVKMTGVWVE